MAPHAFVPMLASKVLLTILQILPLALVPFVATRWCHLHYLQLWSPGSATCIALLPGITLLVALVRIDLKSHSAFCLHPDQQIGPKARAWVRLEYRVRTCRTKFNSILAKAKYITIIAGGDSSKCSHSFARTLS